MLILNKKIFKIIMLIFCILAFYYTNVQAVVDPTPDFYVNDYANVLSENTKEYIMNTNVELESKTKAQIVVVTVKSLEGKSVEEYATEVFRKFGIGDKTKNNGVLFLVSTGDRRLRIEVGYGLEGAIPDGKAGRIRDNYITPYLKNDNYDEGIKNGYNAILEEVCKEYNVEITGAIKAVRSSSKGTAFDDFATFLFISIFGISFLSLINKKPIRYICLIYSLISPIICYIKTKNLIISIGLLVINLILYFGKGLTSGGFYRRPEEAFLVVAGGDFSGGRRLITVEDGSSGSF